MQSDLTIPNTCSIQIVTYQPEYSAFCRIGNAPFRGWLEIKCRPADRLLEFEAFERWLHGETRSCTIEELGRLVFDCLTKALGDIPLRVTVHARTTVHAPVSATIQRGEP